MKKQNISQQQRKKQNKEFKNRCYGIIIVKSEHSNFNADFSGFPRRLPNGTIYATDKALKYAIRRYWIDTGQNVFVWKEYDENGSPYDLESRYKNVKRKVNKNEGNVLKILLGCIDVRCFGITFALKNNNYSICGPVQISYGINRFNENVVYANQILSPYKTEKEKEQSTIGSEIKAMESHYVFDFVINPKNLYDHYNENVVNDLPKLTKVDIDLLKEAMCKSVTNLNSTSKIGSENELLLFITLKENSLLQLPTMKDVVNITKEEEKYKIDLSKVFKYLDESSKFSSEIESIEIYYNQLFVEIIGDLKNKNIFKQYSLN